VSIDWSALRALEQVTAKATVGFSMTRSSSRGFTKKTYEDKDRQEAVIRESSLDWIIVRPASFNDGPKRGHLRAETDLNGVTIRSISRADAAAFVLEQVSSDRYLRTTPLVGD